MVPVRMERVICCQCLEEDLARRYYRLSVIAVTILLPGKFPSFPPGVQRLQNGSAVLVVTWLCQVHGALSVHVSSNTDQIRGRLHRKTKTPENSHLTGTDQDKGYVNTSHIFQKSLDNTLLCYIS